MKDVWLLLIHLVTVVAKLLGPGGIKGIIAENLSCSSSNYSLSVAPGNVRRIYFRPTDFYLASFHCFSGLAAL